MCARSIVIVAALIHCLRRVLRRKDEARRLLAIFIPDVKEYTLTKVAVDTAGDLECKLTMSAVLSQLREVWFLAHLVGW